ncbi:MAG TPA: hypothetical protein VJB57_09610 [Dehalococcoidia bacterium]|nr:hypothetical protein [Dehalococcoidia bacterium]
MSSSLSFRSRTTSRFTSLLHSYRAAPVGRDPRYEHADRVERPAGAAWYRLRLASAQALAFIAGPTSAALFGALSLDLGFVVLGLFLLFCALLLALALRDPRPPQFAT